MAAPYPLAGEGREGVVMMWMGTGIGRHVGDVAVAYATLRDDVIRECLHLCAPAPEHSHLKATVMVEMDMEGCLRKAVMGVEILGQERSEEHTSELQSLTNLVCRLLLEKKKKGHRVEYAHPFGD